MKVTVITGSPHKKGTSALLADEFIRGAQEAGWDTFRFDAAFEKVSPCLGCDRCGIGAAPCVQKDAMQRLTPELLASQAVALVTPLYYGDRPLLRKQLQIDWRQKGVPAGNGL